MILCVSTSYQMLPIIVLRPIILATHNFMGVPANHLGVPANHP